jgi:hypothetical protein
MLPSSMRFGYDYHNAKQMQTVVLKHICDEKTPARDVVQLTRSWIDLERLKREIRGIPPLAAASLKEIADYKHTMAKKIQAFELEITELPDEVPAAR